MPTLRLPGYFTLVLVYNADVLPKAARAGNPKENQATRVLEYEYQGTGTVVLTVMHDARARIRTMYTKFSTYNRVQRT